MSVSQDEKKSADITVGIVAGEASGDTLGEGLIRSVKNKYPKARFFGIGGPKMIAQGCESFFDIEELSVMGITEVVSQILKILRIKSALRLLFKANRPDVFVGIDSPEFNLRLESDLKKIGIRTVHYVSPSVWAWRQKRIHKIALAADLVLVLLPFEKRLYDRFHIPCEFVGHSLADSIPMESDKYHARNKLGIDFDKTWIAVFPGSRRQEIDMLSAPFIQACQSISRKKEDVGFIVASANERCQKRFIEIWKSHAPRLSLFLVSGAAQNVIAASDITILASGTATLECMLVNRPMVVGYRVNSVTAWIARRLVKTRYFSLPNILAEKPLVKEFLMEECTAENLSQEVLHLLSSDTSDLKRHFKDMHLLLRKGADKRAAQSVLNLIGK